MAFTIQSSLQRSGDSLYYDASFRNHIESHLNILANLNPKRHTVPPELAHQFEGNLYGYLTSIGQGAEYHWITMRTNGYHSPYEFGIDTIERAKPGIGVTLLLPDTNLVSRIRTLYLSKKKSD